MANGDTRATSPEVAQLSERVTNMGGRVGNLETMFQREMGELSSKIDRLSESFRTKPGFPWPALGAGVAMLTILGGLAYAPIVMGQNTTNQRVVTVEENSRLNVEALRVSFDAQLASLRIQQEAAVDDLRSQQIGLREHERTLNDIAAVREAATQAVTREGFNLRVGQLEEDINRNSTRLDELADAFGGQYSLRDAIDSILDRLNRLEMTASRTVAPFTSGP